MKITKMLMVSLMGPALLIAASGCSTTKSSSDIKSGGDLSSSGPNIINPRVSPSTVELNEQMQAEKITQIVAEIKDFSANITDVTFRFIDAPFEIKLQNVGGTTWSAQVSQNLLQKLAVGNQTIIYSGKIYAKDSAGDQTVSPPIELSIKTG